MISGDTTGRVVEAGGVANGTPGTSFATGDLDSTDVDNTSDSWTAIDTPTLSANGYGTFTIDAAGLWTYTLDNGNAGRAGAQCRRDADRHVHRHDGRRHHPAGDHHHQRQRTTPR